MREYNFEQLKKAMEDLISRGFTCYVKWTCEGCGERVTCTTSNAIFTEGYEHTEKKDGSECGFVTYPEKYGLVIMKAMGEIKE